MKVEIVNEVSKKTLGSYVKKAATEIGTSAIKGDYKKMQKNIKGLDASDKLAKEEVDIEEGKKKGLWDRIHAKRERIKAGSGEKKAKTLNVEGDKDYPGGKDM